MNREVSFYGQKYVYGEYMVILIRLEFSISGNEPKIFLFVEYKVFLSRRDTLILPYFFN